MKRTLILLALAAISFPVAGQYYGRNVNRPYAYLGLTVGGGLTDMLYSASDATLSPGAGIDLGVHYTHFFSAFGIGFGMHYMPINTHALYNGMEVTEGLTHADNPGARYNLITRFDGWKERQNIVMLGLPVEAFFRAHMGGGRFFISGVGVQLEMPIRGTYSPADGSYTTSGVFPALGSYEVGDMPEHGFGTYSDTYGTQISGLKVGVGMLADLGVRLPLGSGGGLYIGLYGSCSITNHLGEPRGEPLLTINSRNASQIVYNGTFAGDVSSLRLLRVGVKVGIDLASPMDL